MIWKYIKHNYSYLLVLPLSIYVLLVALLINNGESLISQVSIKLYFYIALLSIIPIIFIAIFGEKSKQFVLSSVIFSFVYAMYFDNAPIFFNIIYGKLLSAILIFFIIYLVVNRAGTNFIKIVYVFFTILILTTIFTTTLPAETLKNNSQFNPSVDKESKLPDYIHIILDEHIGVEGIKIDAIERREYVNNLIYKYIENNFQVFGRAFSSFDKTTYAIPSFLNFSTSINNLDAKFSSGDRIKENKLFDNLNNKGYVFNIYENDFMDFCNYRKYKINKCIKYRTDILFLQDETDRNKIISVLRYIAERYRVSFLWYKLALSDFGKFFNIPLYTAIDRYGKASLNIIDEIKNDVLNSKGGNAFFAHLLVPHAPFTFYSDCKNKIQLKDNDRSYDSYFMQLQCTQKKILELINTLKNNNKLNDSIVVIHGDHGSRLTNYAKSNLDYDTMDRNSTFFAVHLLSSKKGNYNITTSNVSDILEYMHMDLFNNLSLTDDINSDLYIYSLNNKDKFEKKLLLPFIDGKVTDFWVDKYENNEN